MSIKYLIVQVGKPKAARRHNSEIMISDISRLSVATIYNKQCGESLTIAKPNTVSPRGNTLQFVIASNWVHYTFYKEFNLHWFVVYFLMKLQQRKKMSFFVLMEINTRKQKERMGFSMAAQMDSKKNQLFFRIQSVCYFSRAARFIFLRPFLLIP